MLRVKIQQETQAVLFKHFEQKINVIYSDFETEVQHSEYSVKRSQVPRLCSEQAPYRDL